MSNRSILEINHDFSHEIASDPDVFVALLKNALASGSHESWEQLRRFGIRRIVQVQHSTKVVISGPGWTREYPVG